MRFNVRESGEEVSFQGRQVHRHSTTDVSEAILMIQADLLSPDGQNSMEHLGSHKEVFDSEVTRSV